MSKVTVAFLQADPRLDGLRLDLEFKGVQQKLHDSQQAGLFNLQVFPAIAAQELQERLLQVRPQILHFSGHGNEKGLYFEGKVRGRGKLVGARPLADALAIVGTTRCVVLCACFSDEMAKLVTDVGKVDVALGFEGALPDDVAIEFASGFYLGLASGLTVERAFDLGKNRLALMGIPAKTKFQLHVRDGVLADQLRFATAPPPPAAERPQGGAIERIDDMHYRFQNVAIFRLEQRTPLPVAGRRLIPASPFGFVTDPHLNESCRVVPEPTCSTCGVELWSQRASQNWHSGLACYEWHCDGCGCFWRIPATFEEAAETVRRIARRDSPSLFGAEA